MATPIRPLLTTALRAQRTFASSSRVGLDFTIPRRAGAKVTLELPPHLQPPPIPSPSTAPRPSTASPTPTVPPAFNLPTTASPSAAEASTSSTFAPRTRNKSKQNVWRYKPLEQPSSDRFSATAVTHIFHIKSTRNNVHLTFVDAVGPLFPTITAGTDRIFKGSQRSTYEAASQAALKSFEKVLDYARENRVQMLVNFKGYAGAGREAVSSALSGPEGAEVRKLIVKISDTTPLSTGGCRPPKRRRI